MAKDLFHDAVRVALEKRDWVIVNAPLVLSVSQTLTYYIDIAAEKFIIATKETELIVVEIKTFMKNSKTYEFHAALGQYCIYKSALKYLNMPQKLFLAVPHQIYTTFFQQPFFQQVLKDYNCNIISFSPDKKEIIYGEV